MNFVEVHAIVHLNTEGAKRYIVFQSIINYTHIRRMTASLMKAASSQTGWM